MRVYEPGYLTPDTYAIRAWLRDAPDGTCEWLIDDAVQTTASCGSSVELRLGAKAAGGERGGSGRILVRAGDATVVDEVVTVDDVLIVAMGDSFISGEGNPDQPSRYEQFPASEAYSRADWPSELHPGLVRRAEWWDEPCHRSLLSWPVLASLSDAARHPQRATTFVHLGCSGAEAATGLYGTQRGLPGGGHERAPQFVQLEELLTSSGRSVDRVLMSIGGNDAGFVPVIEYALIPPNGYRYNPISAIPGAIIGRFWSSEGPIRPYRTDALPLGVLGGFRESAESRLERLPQEYDRVARDLVQMKIDPAVIYQTTYPDILRDRNGEFCRTTLSPQDITALRNGYGVTRNVAQANREEAFRANHPGSDRGGFEALLAQVPGPLRTDRWFFQFHFMPEPDATPVGKSCDLKREADDSEVCKAFWVWSRLNAEVRANAARWTIVTMDTEATHRRGWCETKPGDSLNLPIAVRDETGIWAWEGGREPYRFQPYDPALGRWFRTANDSTLTQYGGPDRYHQGSIHPTFNAHVAYAEQVIQAIRD